MSDRDLLKRAAVYVCVVADMDAGCFYGVELHRLARDLQRAGVRCPHGHGGWRHVLRRLRRDQKDPVCNSEGHKP